MGVEKSAEMAQRFLIKVVRGVIEALKLLTAKNGRVAASCSSVFLLQNAGLVKNKRVTTSWWLAKELQRLEPTCKVDADRMVCADEGIVTAGAAFAQTELMLHLLRELCGNNLAAGVSRALLIDGRQAQAPFVVPEAFCDGEDLVGRLAQRIENSLPDLPKVGELAKEFCMSERTLSRHIQKVTWRGTLALMQSVKQRRARTLLESSRMSVEKVAASVGYKDAPSLTGSVQ